MDPKILANGLVQFVVFLFSTTCHEAAHALAAKKGGDLTAFHGGQVTLNPLPHIRREPFGMIVMPILCYVLGGLMIGWASAPYDPSWAQRYPRRAGLMSLAGPMANFTLVLIAALFLNLGSVTGFFGDTGEAGGIEHVLKVLFSLNLLLCLFNLIPIPPLDGFTALGLILPENAALRLFEIGNQIRPFSFLFLLLGWQYFGRILDPANVLAAHYLLRFYQ